MNRDFYETDYIREFGRTHAEPDEPMSDIERAKLEAELDELRSEWEPLPQLVDPEPTPDDMTDDMTDDGREPF